MGRMSDINDVMELNGRADGNGKALVWNSNGEGRGIKMNGVRKHHV